MHYGEHLAPAFTDTVRRARAVWIICLSNSTFDIDGLFKNCASREVTSILPAHSKRRIMFPCPMHNNLDPEAQADVIRRSKLARKWGLEVRWVDHEILQSMFIINPPIQNDPNFGDGLALIELSLPHLDSTVPAKFEITQTDQDKMFSDLVKSFSQTWGTAHEPSYEKTQQAVKPARLLKGLFVA